MNYTDFKSVREKVLSGAVSVKEITAAFLEKAKADNHNIFLEVFAESATTAAVAVDEKVKTGNAGRLAGMVIAIKDNICYRGHKVSAASKILGDFESLFSATAVERLVAEDAVIIGRTNCDEFAMGSSNENSAFGPVKNPLDPSKVSGGSSGGSAAAVAAGLCHASLGSDTGGSIRQPAAFCGIVGFKPTYGRISRHGLIAYASSFDQIGPFTNSVVESALLTEIMAGKDDFDSTASSVEVGSYGDLKPNTAPKKIAVIKQCLEAKGLTEAAKQNFDDYLKKLKAQGHQITEVSFDMLDQLVPTYYVLCNAEASSNLARFDGVHYGSRSDKSEDVDSTYFNSRSEGFGTEVKRRIMAGTFVLSAGYYDAYYGKAQKVRQLVRQQTLAILEEHDFVATPTTPHAAFGIGEQKDPIAMYLEDLFTVQANLSGVPAIAVPHGKNEAGLPLSVQLMGKPFGEQELFEMAAGL